MRVEKVEARSARVPDPDYGGVYLVFLRDGRRLLEKTHHHKYSRKALLELGGDPLMYVGSSLSLFKRMKSHVRGDSRQSNLRITVASILADELKLVGKVTGPNRQCHFGDGEERLSQYMVDNMTCLFLKTKTPREMEAVWIKDQCPPFNISLRRENGYAKHLMVLRRQFGYSANLPVEGYRRSSNVNRDLGSTPKAEDKDTIILRLGLAAPRSRLPR